MNSIKLSVSEFANFILDLKRLVNNKKWRWINIWFSPTPFIYLTYRVDRAGYLLTGKYWAGLRLLLFPLFLLGKILGAGHEIHYRAQIGGGLQILHPTLGIVVSGYAVCGKNLTLTGGNCIGGRKALRKGDLIIGENVNLGVNAVILGPVQIGDNTNIGAAAVVISSFPGNSTLVGAPARSLEIKQ